MATTILILAANPMDSTRLRLDEEVREIEQGLGRAKERDRFILEAKWAVRPRDVQRAMLDHEPNIIHFSGHGGGSEGIVFEDDGGHSHKVKTAALAGLFALFAESIQCVVLNACYSEVQASAIARHIPYVVGMNKAIGDKAAIEFAVAFYDAIGAGRDIEFAYKLGCNAIRMAGIPEHLTPVLKQSGDPTGKDNDSDTVTTEVLNKTVNLLYADRSQPMDTHVIELLEKGLLAEGYAAIAPANTRSLDLEVGDSAPVSKPLAEIVLLSNHSVQNQALQQRLNLLQQHTASPPLIPVSIRFNDKLPEASSAYLHDEDTVVWQGIADDNGLLEAIIQRLENLSASPSVQKSPPLTDTGTIPESTTVRSLLPMGKPGIPELWLSFIVEQKADQIICEWLEDEARGHCKIPLNMLLPFSGSPAQLKAMQTLLPDVPDWQGKKLRLRIMTDDPQLALLPWQKLQVNGASASLIETGPVLRRYLSGFTATPLSTPLLIIPAGHEHDMMGDKHFTLIQEYLASHLGIRGPVPRVTNPQQIQRELSLHKPDLLYIYVRYSDGQLLLDSDHNGNNYVTLDELAAWIKAAEIRPVVILSLLAQGFRKYSGALASSSCFVWVQQTRRQSRIDDLEESFAAVLEGLAQNEDISYLIQQEGNKPRHDLHHHLWHNGRSPAISLSGDDGQRQLRAALLKVMLGRNELKDRMHSGIYRTDYLNTPTFLVYTVSGTEIACPFDFPAQVQQRLQWDDPERGLPVIPFYFHLNITAAADAFDVIDTALSQGLLHGTSDIDIIFQEELQRRGLLNQECCISLNWLVQVPIEMTESIEEWLNVWMEILCHDFAEAIPEKCILIGCLCLQATKDVDAQDLQDKANHLLSRNPYCQLRLIRIKDALGKLEPEEISDFLQYNQHWRAALKLDEYEIAPYDYSRWVYTRSKDGEFDSTIRVIWQQYQQEYQDYLSQQD